jgi:hypothetical protein
MEMQLPHALLIRVGIWIRETPDDLATLGPSGFRGAPAVQSACPELVEARQKGQPCASLQDVEYVILDQ